MSKSHYDREKSRVKDEKLAEFLTNDLGEDLTCVPGVGPKTVQLLNDDGIETSFQLLAKFMSFRSKGATEDAVCEAMYQYLAGLGVSGYRSGITTCLHEKASVILPEFFSNEKDDY